MPSCRTFGAVATNWRSRRRRTSEWRSPSTNSLWQSDPEARPGRFSMPQVGITQQTPTDYLRHHLALAGRADTLFSDDAAALIHQTSRGYPRAVNNLALQALLAAFADTKNIVDESSARTAITEVTTE